MAVFKKGDRVRIVKPKPADEYNYLKGKVGEIIDLRGNSNYKWNVKVDGGGSYGCNEDELSFLRGRPVKPKPAQFIAIYDEEDGDPVKKFYSRRELMKWLKEAQDDEEIIWNSIEVYSVSDLKKPKANVKISLRKV